MDEGHDPTCLEKATDQGGVFRFGEHDGVVWECCRLTRSGALTAFSDFPAPPERMDHMLSGEYAGCLAGYSDAFGVGRRIRFGTTVECVSRSPHGGWVVRTLDSSHVQSEERFDAVAICSGLNQYPHLPSYPGQTTFTGAVMHAAQYRRPDQVAGSGRLPGGRAAIAEVVMRFRVRSLTR